MSHDVSKLDLAKYTTITVDAVCGSTWADRSSGWKDPAFALRFPGRPKVFSRQTQLDSIVPFTQAWHENARQSDIKVREHLKV